MDPGSQGSHPETLRFSGSPSVRDDRGRVNIDLTP